VKLFFEQYPYSPEDVKDILDKDLYTDYNGSKVIPYVGYYYAPNIKNEDGHIVGDSIFILPKVFITQGKLEGEEKARELAFGRYKPEDIIDVDTKEVLEKKDNEVIFGLSTWLYKAIAHFVERHQSTGISREAYIQNVVSFRGEEDQTYLDTILSLLKFHKEHKNLFTYITILNSSGRSTINWDKTINKSVAIIKRGVPFYPETIAKDKAVNYDEDLIVLFYSVLNYLKNKYQFRVDRKIEYKLIKPNKIQQLIDSGKGLRILKDIRKKYFTDELVALWNLLRVFFDKAHRVATKKYTEERLLVRSFNIVFEDMIDQLLGDKKEDILDGSLKDQADGKRIDHIYKDAALIPNSEIYYIGDSKYYKDGNDVTGSAFFKQYTYAKNVIQVCMNIFEGGAGKDLLGKIRYVDTKTEGYNITPNFFIRGNITNFNNFDYTNLELSNDTPDDISKNRSIQWKDRLFDRDTLIVQSYNINFLFVLSAYVGNSNDEATKTFIHRQFRNDILKTLAKNYCLYKVHPKNLDDFVEKYFRLLCGKMYRGNDVDNFIWLAFEHNSETKDADLKKIELDCTISKPGVLKKDNKGIYNFEFEGES
jgi:hypothetical protein